MIMDLRKILTKMMKKFIKNTYLKINQLQQPMMVKTSTRVLSPNNTSISNNQIIKIETTLIWRSKFKKRKINLNNKIPICLLHLWAVAIQGNIG